MRMLNLKTEYFIMNNLKLMVFTDCIPINFKISSFFFKIKLSLIKIFILLKKIFTLFDSIIKRFEIN
jgi:hypothetical protein